MTTRKISRVALTGNGARKIANIICPDGSRRTMYINDGNMRGFVQVSTNGKSVSVAGYAKAVGQGFKFFPHQDAKNIELVRPAALPLKSRVVLADGRVGTVVAVGWNYLSPRYSVRLDTIEVDSGDLSVMA